MIHLLHHWVTLHKQIASRSTLLTRLIRLDKIIDGASYPDYTLHSVRSFTHNVFKQMTTKEVEDQIKAAPNKYCLLVTVMISLVKNCATLPVAPVQRIAGRRLHSCIAEGCNSLTSFKEACSYREQNELQAGTKFVIYIQACRTFCL